MCLAKALSISLWRWHGLLLAGSRIVVNVVASAVPQKRTALFFDLADQFAALHSAISFVL